MLFRTQHNDATCLCHVNGSFLVRVKVQPLYGNAVRPKPAAQKIQIIVNGIQPCGKPCSCLRGNGTVFQRHKLRPVVGHHAEPHNGIAGVNS